MNARRDSYNEPQHGSFGWRSLLFAAILLALVAVAVLVLSDDLKYMRLGIVAGLWAALVGAFIAARYRRQAVEREEEAAQRQERYELELEREVAARREHELRVEAEARRRVEAESHEDIAALRAELYGLRQTLQTLMGGEFLVERYALRAESTRMRSLPESHPFDQDVYQPKGLPPAQRTESDSAASARDAQTDNIDRVPASAESPSRRGDRTPARARVEPEPRASEVSAQWFMPGALESDESDWGPSWEATRGAGTAARRRPAEESQSYGSRPYAQWNSSANDHTSGNGYAPAANGYPAAASGPGQSPGYTDPRTSQPAAAHADPSAYGDSSSRRAASARTPATSSASGTSASQPSGRQVAPTARSTQSAHAVQSAQSAHTAQSAQSAHAVQSAQSAHAFHAGQAAQSARSAQPAQSVQSAQAAQASQSGQMPAVQSSARMPAAPSMGRAQPVGPVTASSARVQPASPHASPGGVRPTTPAANSSRGMSPAGYPAASSGQMPPAGHPASSSRMPPASPAAASTGGMPPGAMPSGSHAASPPGQAAASSNGMPPAGRARPASRATSSRRDDQSYGALRPGEISARMEAVTPDRPGRTPPATSSSGPPAVPTSGRMQPTGYVDAGRPAPNLPSYSESQPSAAASGYPAPGARPTETPGSPGAAGQRPAERTGYGVGNGYGSGVENGYGTGSGNGYGTGYADGYGTGTGIDYGGNGADFAEFGPTGYSEHGRRSVESGYVAPVAFGPTGTPVDRRSVESGYVAPVARYPSDDSASGGRRRTADRAAWQDPSSHQHNGASSGSHADAEPSGSHSAGRSVSDLLASHGGTASPRRRRRRED